jgi:hypothetical protein
MDFMKLKFKLVSKLNNTDETLRWSGMLLYTAIAYEIH